MTKYLKPQTPIQLEDNYIYPLTTADQIILGNGNRLNSLFKKTIQENIILRASNWSDTLPYTQTITLTVSVDDYKVDANVIYTGNDNTDSALNKAAGCFSYIKKNHKEITFYCLKKKPEIDISIEITGTCKNTIANVKEGIKLPVLTNEGTSSDLLSGKQLIDQDGNIVTGTYEGIELNFKIVGGTAQPTNPTENMIWVNTSTEITEWYFSPHQPNSNIEGDLWIKIGSASDAPFNALKENNITIYPISTKQYIGGAWVDKTVKCYQDGEWASWVIYLFNDGNQFTDRTGGWATLNYYGDGHASIGTNMDFWCTASGNPWCWFETNNKIDLTSATWVKALVTASVANDHVLIGITDTFYTSNNIHPKLQTFIAQTVITPTVGATRELAVNVSSLSGKYYILLKNSACNGSFTKVWLE